MSLLKALRKSVIFRCQHLYFTILNTETLTFSLHTRSKLLFSKWVSCYFLNIYIHQTLLTHICNTKHREVRYYFYKSFATLYQYHLQYMHYFSCVNLLILVIISHSIRAVHGLKIMNLHFYLCFKLPTCTFKITLKRGTCIPKSSHNLGPGIASAQLCINLNLGGTWGRCITYYSTENSTWCFTANNHRVCDVYTMKGVEGQLNK